MSNNLFMCNGGVGPLNILALSDWTKISPSRKSEAASYW